ncbi:hypothetical protein HOLleu_00678 [Holothuria leucospilota]|uniref:Uncharacterized protein n=1 Tax=Holothuria leucospilota TaxID=206669 RepID=A0A9Q1HKH4_HOLLE|nr:hypothetical protein HOLleu_00678 [Holothuria leucospilota]
MYLVEVLFVNALIIFRSCDPARRKPFRADKFRNAIIAGLLEGHHNTSQRASRRSLERPVRLEERQFWGYHPEVKKDGRRSRQDCVVCSDRKIKRHQT